MGRPLWVKSLADHFGTDIAYIHATRKHQEKKIDQIIGNVRGKIVIIYDDIVRSAGTLIRATQAYIDSGAPAAFAVLSHFAVNDTTIIDRLIDSPIERIITTNSHPMSQIVPPEKFQVIDVTPIFAKSILALLN